MSRGKHLTTPSPLNTAQSHKTHPRFTMHKNLIENRLRPVPFVLDWFSGGRVANLLTQLTEGQESRSAEGGGIFQRGHTIKQRRRKTTKPRSFNTRALNQVGLSWRFRMFPSKLQSVYLENKHLSPEHRHRVEVPFADVGPVVIRPVGGPGPVRVPRGRLWWSGLWAARGHSG